ncbi:MAG: succinate dehydrogenase, cytochrome b556 subunit [Betaproteobacteria bacterium]
MSDLSTTQVRKKRPEFKNIGIKQILGSYRLPWAGKVSILHRASGGILFITLPFILYLFDKSISSELSFMTFSQIVGNPLVKIVLLGLIWAFLHHFCAGIRFLLIDTHHGVEKHQIQSSAKLVLILSIALTLVLGAKLFNLF